MSLYQFWSKPSGKMPPKQLLKKKETPAVSPRDGDATLAVNTSLDPDSSLTKALEVITANIAAIMDEKLEKMLHYINTNISQSLKEVTYRINEVEQRILVVGNASTDA